jgi:hypothetical protein
MFRILILLIPVLMTGCSNGREIKDFKSDGCSLFPDKSIISRDDWCDCCFQHDLLYWQGGTEAERLKADEALRECILQKTGNVNLARVMYSGVRFGGSPYFYNWYRWGYGWNYDRKYAELSEEEKKLIEKKLNDYFSNPPENPCR